MGGEGRGPAVGPVSELHRSAFPLRGVEVNGVAIMVSLSGYGVTANSVEVVMEEGGGRVIRATIPSGQRILPRLGVIDGVGRGRGLPGQLRLEFRDYRPAEPLGLPQTGGAKGSLELDDLPVHATANHHPPRPMVQF